MRDTPDPSSDAIVAQIEEMATGYIAPTLLFAAIELDLFAGLDEAMDIRELAAKLAVTSDGLRRLCRVLAAMGLLRLSGDRVEPIAQARAVLARGGEGWSLLRHHGRHLLPLFLQLPSAVRTGRPQHSAWSFASSPSPVGVYEELTQHPEELAAFLSAMDRSSRGVGASLVPLLHERGVQRLVDLGCGGGMVAREILSQMPDIHIESFDLAETCAVAERRSVAAGWQDRHRVSPGDVRVGTDARDADAVLLSAILADWSAPERAAILAGAYQNLRPGGHLLISETLLDDDQSGPMGSAILSVVMLLAMRGDQLTGAMLTEELLAAGFVDVQVSRSRPRDIVLARRP